MGEEPDLGCVESRAVRRHLIRTVTKPFRSVEAKLRTEASVPR